MNYCPAGAASVHREAKVKAKEKGKVGATISQRAALIVTGSVEEGKDNASPRCNRELYIFKIASGPIVRCRRWDLAGAPCTLIRARWRFGDWFWWPRH